MHPAAMRHQTPEVEPRLRADTVEGAGPASAAERKNRGAPCLHYVGDVASAPATAASEVLEESGVDEKEAR